MTTARLGRGSLTAPRSRKDSRQFLEARRESVARLLPDDHVLARDPVELNRAARSFVQLVAMPGVARPAEYQQRPPQGWHLDSVVLEVRPAPQQAQAPAIRRPVIVEVEKDGYDLGLAVRMNGAIPFSDMPPDRRHRRRPTEID